MIYGRGVMGADEQRLVPLAEEEAYSALVESGQLPIGAAGAWV